MLYDYNGKCRALYKERMPGYPHHNLFSRIYALVGRAISIRDPYICAVSKFKMIPVLR